MCSCSSERNIRYNTHICRRTDFAVTFVSVALCCFTSLDLPNTSEACRGNGMVNFLSLAAFNCTMNILETEYHYLLVCPNYYNLRTKYMYIKIYYFTRPSLHKLTQLLSSKSKFIICTNISTFILFANKTRS